MTDSNGNHEQLQYPVKHRYYASRCTSDFNIGTCYAEYQLKTQYKNEGFPEPSFLSKIPRSDQKRSFTLTIESR